MFTSMEVQAESHFYTPDTLTKHQQEYKMGRGIAAPQIGYKKRVVYIQTKAYTGYLVNPEIVSTEGEVENEEGCLSLPGLTLKMCRSEKVVARGLNRHGEGVEIEADGLLARALQHEIDHLNGVLLIDRLHPIHSRRPGY